MKLIKYGVHLKRIREEDLETLRAWRNAEKIRDNMLYREYITPEMQKEWFDKINNYDNFYYIIYYKNEAVGLINNKNTDRSVGSSDSGLFLYNEKYYNSFVPIAASFILIEVGFYLLRGRDVKIKVLRQNEKAIKYNLKIGFELMEDNPQNNYLEFCLTLDSFLRKTEKLRKAILLQNPEEETCLTLKLDAYDYEIGIGKRVESEIDFLDPTIIKHMDFEGEQKTLILDY
jgi:UDP-4-amino-4,6-dideoxy-N-acetyl-beta-L-altrosamine N-acetyltransferase